MNGEKLHIIYRVLALAMVLEIFVLPLFFIISITTIKQLQHKLLHETTVDLETLEFTTDEYNQLVFVAEDEIIYNGVLYDIKTIEKQNSKYIIKALADEKETALQKADSKQQKQNNTKAYKLQLFYEKPFYTTLVNNIAKYTQPNYDILTKWLIYRQIVTPPPDLI